MVFLFSLLTDIQYCLCSSTVLHSQGFCNGQLRVWCNVEKSEQAKKYRALNVLARVTDIWKIIPVVVLLCAVQQHGQRRILSEGLPICMAVSTVLELLSSRLRSSSISLFSYTPVTCLFALPLWHLKSDTQNQNSKQEAHRLANGKGENSSHLFLNLCYVLATRSLTVQVSVRTPC